MKKFFLYLWIMPLVLLATVASGQEHRNLRKAAIAVEQSDFEQALELYGEILDKDSGSYHGNAGMGVVLSEYIGNHERAIHFLERALRHSPEKTRLKLNTDLGRSYHHLGHYKMALHYYANAQSLNREDHPDFDVFLNKRIADCKYALDHPEVAPVAIHSVKNMGAPINSELPEYSPVYVNGQMIFTAQKKDTKFEKKNGVDGRYFESMYITKHEDGGFTDPERFTLPNLGEDSKFLKHNESVLSASTDGKKLFIFRNGQIYEANMDEPKESAEKLDKTINLSVIQSHACLSPDGKTLYFASEADRGMGGSDIYKSERKENGAWSTPILLGINTSFNEDSPFLTEDGTLYFSSNGLPGYGGYDVYKTKLVSGEWSKPENLGQPINSPADDMYFTLLPNSSYGYYSSGRSGGKGDMDIYQVHYISPEVPDCSPSREILAIKPEKNGSELSYHMNLDLPEKYNSELNSYMWKVNDDVVSNDKKFEYDFKYPSAFTVTAKAVVYCDSCPALKAFCTQKVMSVGEVLAIDPSDDPVLDLNRPEKLRHSSSKIVELNENELRDIGWDEEPAKYIVDDYRLDDRMKNAINHNINVLKNNPNLKVSIYGHADSRGSDAYNNALSQKRAREVYNYLISNGIPASRISVVKGKGERELTNHCNNDTECSDDEHAPNRRVVLKVYKRVDAVITYK